VRPEIQECREVLEISNITLLSLTIVTGQVLTRRSECKLLQIVERSSCLPVMLL